MLDLNPNFTNKHSNRNNNNNNSNYRHRFNGGSANVQFRLETMDEDSGFSLSPPDSPVRFPNRSLSPASRAQAIARGQREMMEMVDNMPETSYELSLKDIVDQRLEFTDASVDETQSMEDGEQRLINSGGSQRRRVKRTESSSNSKTGRIIVKNGSMNNNNKRLLINMFLPLSIGSKKKTKSFNRTNSYLNSFNQSAGVKSSELLNKSGAGDGGVDRRDWRTKVTETSSSSGGESTGRSDSSGSSGSGSSSGSSLRNNSDRRDDGCTQGCWSCFPYRKRKS
ncbi:uncharacterized protein LOC143542532 [Bidens hawaiensis]|uniref:uncharacterized protein LOC143542532 n=1 Tax=Bidens hawaiensis TaxID=980011 RepID=UPI004049B37B